MDEELISRDGIGIRTRRAMSLCPSCLGKYTQLTICHTHARARVCSVRVFPPFAREYCRLAEAAGPMVRGTGRRYAHLDPETRREISLSTRLDIHAKRYATENDLRGLRTRR